MTHYFKAFDRTATLTGLFAAACGQEHLPETHSTEPTCPGCRLWLADAGQRLPLNDNVPTLTHEAGSGPWTLTTYAPVFRVRTTHHFFTEAGREAFVRVAMGHGLVIEKRDYEATGYERAAS